LLGFDMWARVLPALAFRRVGAGAAGGLERLARSGRTDRADFLEPLKAASKDLQAAGMFFMQNGMKNPNAALSGSYDFMHLFGHVCLGLMWAQMAKAAQEALDGGASDKAFYETKLATGRYYMARRLPATAMHLARINTGADTVMALNAEQF
ncbi:MAG: acyl-CoA dehydrogenase C-terminal domain-containing protein, partial [Pseudomonadota bacterium]|nr:acyl-CoA dehydrogenase C-terminal domain-containing protein [Pseudomonadota bacterium]